VNELRFLKRLVTLIDKANRSMFWIVGAVCVVACTIIFVDVVLRYLFSTVTPFGYEATLWATLLIALLAGGYITQIHEHITVDILYLKMGRTGKQIINYLVYAIMIFVAVVMVVYGMERVLYYFERGTKSIGGMKIYLWIKWVVVPFSGLLLGLQSIAEIIKETYYLVTGSCLLPPIVKPDKVEDSQNELMKEGEQ